MRVNIYFRWHDLLMCERTKKILFICNQRSQSSVPEIASDLTKCQFILRNDAHLVKPKTLIRRTYAKRHETWITCPLYVHIFDHIISFGVYCPPIHSYWQGRSKFFKSKVSSCVYVNTWGHTVDRARCVCVCLCEEWKWNVTQDSCQAAYHTRFSLSPNLMAR